MIVVLDITTKAARTMALQMANDHANTPTEAIAIADSFLDYIEGEATPIRVTFEDE